MSQTNKCASCIHFGRIKFHKSIDKDEGFQKVGTCKVIKDVLLMSNSSLWSHDHLYVQESFGCILFHGEEKK